jgi:hypothetical protein
MTKLRSHLNVDDGFRQKKPPRVDAVAANFAISARTIYHPLIDEGDLQATQNPGLRTGVRGLDPEV